MSFTREDLDVLVDEQLEIGTSTVKDCLDWMQAREIEPPAVTALLTSAGRTFPKLAAEHGQEAALYQIAGQMFRLGWEAALTTRETLHVD